MTYLRRTNIEIEQSRIRMEPEHSAQEIKLSTISPRKLVESVKSLPPLAIKSFVKENLLGLRIRASGKLSSVRDNDRDVTLYFNDDDGTWIAAYFKRPIDAQLALLKIDDRVSVIGTVSDVDERSVSVSNCELGEGRIPGARTESVGAKWHHKPWGNLTLGIVASVIATGVVALLVVLYRLILRH